MSIIPSDREMRMPFGKFRGVPIGEIETSYLQWLHKTVDLREPLRTAVASVLKAKAVQGPLRVPGSTPGAAALNVGADTASPARFEGVNRGPQHREAVKPKRAWMPRPETEDLSAYYSQGSNDGIPW